MKELTKKEMADELKDGAYELRYYGREKKNTIKKIDIINLLENLDKA